VCVCVGVCVCACACVFSGYVVCFYHHCSNLFSPFGKLAGRAMYTADISSLFENFLKIIF